MTNSISFAKRTIDALPPAAAGKRDYYHDSAIPGLRLQVTATGAKSWQVQRRVKGRGGQRVTLGRYPDMPPAAAKKKATILLAQLAEGVDPQAEKQKKALQAVTLSEALETYLDARRDLKPTTVKGYRQNIEVGLKDWSARPLTAITKTMVAERHAKLKANSGPNYADMVMRTLRLLWNYAADLYEDDQGESMLPTNPVQRLSKTKAWSRTAPRKNYIREHQLPTWFNAVQTLREQPFGTSTQTVGDYLTLVILTGMRKNEAASLKWETVDLKDRSLTLLDTKNRSDHTLPLSDYLAELLEWRLARQREDKGMRDSLFVFPGHGKTEHLAEPRYQMQKVVEASSVTFRLHDLRRTFITIAEKLGLSTYVLSRLVNHEMGHPVTRDYIVMDTERLREPMQHVTNYMLSVAEIRAAACVSPLKRVSNSNAEHGQRH